MHHQDIEKRQNVIALLKILIRLCSSGQIESEYEAIKKMGIKGLETNDFLDLCQTISDLKEEASGAAGATHSTDEQDESDPSPEEGSEQDARKKNPNLFFNRLQTEGFVRGRRELINLINECFPDEESNEVVDLILEHHQNCGVFQLSVKRYDGPNGTRPLEISFEEPYLLRGQEKFHYCDSITELRRTFRKLTRGDDFFEGLRIIEVQ